MDNTRLVTCHFWFAHSLLDFQADSRTWVRNWSAPLMPPRHLHLDFPKHIRNVSRFRLRAHTVAVESSIWLGGNGHCDKCYCAAVQNEVHVLFHCPDLFVCSLRRKYSFLFFPFCQSFLWRPLIFHMPCLVRLSLIFFRNGTIDSAISFRYGIFFGWRRPATNQSA